MDIMVYSVLFICHLSTGRLTSIQAPGGRNPRLDHCVRQELQKLIKASTSCWATEPMIEMFMADPQKGAITAKNWSYAAQYGIAHPYNIQSQKVALEVICRSKTVEGHPVGTDLAPTIDHIARKIKEHMKYLTRRMREATQDVHDWEVCLDRRLRNRRRARLYGQCTSIAGQP